MVEDEKELVDIFNKFWTNHASKDPNVDNWKGYENGSEVVYFLQNKTPKTKKLMECFGYKKTKSTWDNAHDKKKEDGNGEDKEFELEEDKVVWNRITDVLGGPFGYGVNFYVEIRNWPIEWLSESNKHTRQYVLNNIDKGKGLSIIIDTARKKVGEQEEAKKKKEDEKQANVEQEGASEEEEEVNVVPGTTGYVKVSKAEEEPAQSNSRVSNPRFDRVKEEAKTPGAEFINPDKAEQTTGSVDVTVPESAVVNSNENGNTFRNELE